MNFPYLYFAGAWGGLAAVHVVLGLNNHGWAGANAFFAGAFAAFAVAYAVRAGVRA